MNKAIRQPQQQRSIDKKNKIIEAGLTVFCQKGYYNTNSTEIAKMAGVSIGILYSYFKDKKDIFMQSLGLYFDRLNAPIGDFLASAPATDLKTLVGSLIDESIESHKKNKVAHEEMIAMSHLDADVNHCFVEAENAQAKRLAAVLASVNPDIAHLDEKVHIALNMVDNLCHEYVYHRHDYIDYSVMIDQTKRILTALFSE